MDRLSFMRSFFYSQVLVEPEVPKTDCTGKTTFVTGSNVGLGKDAVRRYATHIMTPFPERQAPSIFASLNNEEEARMDNRYPVSKLLEVLACREIVQHHPVEQLRVTLNLVNPDLCQSALHRESDTFFVNTMLRVVARTSEVGSRTITNAGLAGPETHGKYLDDCQVKPCAPLVEGDEGPAIQRRVWQELSGKLNEIQPGIVKVLDA